MFSTQIDIRADLFRGRRNSDQVQGPISNSAADPFDESGLIHTLTLASSAANWLRSFQIAKASAGKVKLTFFVSPEESVTRWKPFNARTG